MEKIVMLGIMAVFLAIPLKKDKAEFSMLLILTACILISMLALWKIRDLVQFIKSLQQYLDSGGVYMKVLLKMIGITYMAQLGANLCRDAGYSAVAAQIEFFGKLMLLAVSMPVLTSLLTLLNQFA